MRPLILGDRDDLVKRLYQGERELERDGIALSGMAWVIQQTRGENDLRKT